MRRQKYQRLFPYGPALIVIEIMHLVEYYPGIIIHVRLFFKHLIAEYLGCHNKDWCMRINRYIPCKDAYFIRKIFLEVSEFLIGECLYRSCIDYLFTFFKTVQYYIFSNHGLTGTCRRRDYYRVPVFNMINSDFLKGIINHIPIVSLT